MSNERAAPRVSVDLRLLVALVASLGALALGVAFLVLERARAGRASTTAELLRDPELRAEFMTRVAAETAGEYDSHPDPDVARVLLPGLHLDSDTVGVNDFGMRERDYALPRPPETTRVVLLGDSFVYGMKAAAQERVGVFLERFLEERSEVPDASIEVLHLAVPSWSLSAECAYLRRQLDQLRPDLVVQVTCSNDLDDVAGVRGFGAMSTFAPDLAGRADGMVQQNFPTLVLGVTAPNFIAYGLEHESRTRFAAARASVQGLVADLARTPDGARYLLVVHWYALNPTFHAHLGHALDQAALLYLPRAFWSDASLEIPGDGHWNAAGHERLARFLYGTIRRRGLLPRLALAEWSAAESEAEELVAAGLDEAGAPPLPPPRLMPTIAPSELTERTARQILGGVDRAGLVAPHAALVLARSRGTTTLHVTGRFLPERVLDGAVVRVFVEELELAQLAIRPGEPLDVVLPLPREALEGRPFLSVRFSGDDYVYRGDDLRRCVLFQLERVALE